MSVKEKLEAAYPNEDWSHLDGGRDGEKPVFWSDGTNYYTHSEYWPSGLTELTSAQILALTS
tara:strand:+ start:700 stop:885 length:186 start_codon:yes stop_codon:yes gene_type:complete